MKKNGSALFAKRLKTERKRLKLTQKQFASVLEVSQATVSHYENGLQFPEKDVLVKICKIFEIEPNELLFNKTSDSNKINTQEDLEEMTKNHKLFLEDVLKEQKNNEQLQQKYEIFVDGQPVTQEELNTMIDYVRFTRCKTDI